MKKVLFSAFSLDIGGIETALLTLLNELAKERKYKITLCLEQKQGVFLDDLDKRIKVIQYKPCSIKTAPIRKAINLLKQIVFFIGHKNRYDFAASYATYSNPGSFVARTASKNSCLFGHMDYLAMFKGNKEEMIKFFIEKKVNKFKHIVFVSKTGRETFIKEFPDLESRTYAINNMIDYNKILKLADEPIEEKKESMITFVNVGRHDEDQKKLSRIIEAAKKLKADNYRFRILFVGDGQDKEVYEKMVYSFGLEDNIKFLGKKKNPYPYYKLADAVVLSSDYEGYPVVFVESMLLDRPLITTDVSDYDEIENKFGIVCEKNSESLYKAMKQFMDQGFEIKNKFNPKQFNDIILENIENLMN